MAGKEFGYNPFELSPDHGTPSTTSVVTTVSFSIPCTMAASHGVTVTASNRWADIVSEASRLSKSLSKGTGSNPFLDMSVSGQESERISTPYKFDKQMSKELGIGAKLKRQEFRPSLRSVDKSVSFMGDTEHSHQWEDNILTMGEMGCSTPLFNRKEPILVPETPWSQQGNSMFNYGEDQLSLSPTRIEETPMPSVVRGIHKYPYPNYDTPSCKEKLRKACTESPLHSDIFGSPLESTCTPRDKRKQKEPQTYDGSTDFKDYIIHFEQVAKWNQWGRYEMAQQLAMSLRGPAQKILADLTMSQVGDYTRIRDVLSSRFDPPGRETAYRCQLKHRTYLKGETLTNYGLELRRLASLAYPSMPANARESNVVDQFIHGLRNHEMKKHVQFNHPSTLEAAITLAIEYEAFDTEENALVRKPKVYVDEVEQVAVQSVRENNTTEKNERDLATLILEGFDKLGEKLSTLNRGGRSSRGYKFGGTRNRGRGRYRNQNRGNSCYKCGEQGHYIAQCPENDEEENKITPEKKN